jgi:hypothetical protein
MLWKNNRDDRGYPGQVLSPWRHVAGPAILQTRPVCPPHIQSSSLFLSLTNVALHELHTAGTMQQRLPLLSIDLPIGHVVVHHLRLVLPRFTFPVAEGDVG